MVWEGEAPSFLESSTSSASSSLLFRRDPQGVAGTEERVPGQGVRGSGQDAALSCPLLLRPTRENSALLATAQERHLATRRLTPS